MNNDLSTGLAEQVTQAYQKKTPVVIAAGGSKSFYGNSVEGTPLDVTQHTGIIEYRPSELVITARSGTRLSDIEDELAANGQMFAFEPLQHSADTTIGGIIACAVSGPRRGFTCAARDAVLGASIINGRGELLKFGGQVMKNVAGYDVSRLMVGAQGTLGILLDISIKVIPRPEHEITLAFEKSFEAAQQDLHDWILHGLPLSASCYYAGQLHLRLSSTENSIQKSQQVMGGEVQDNRIWAQLRQQTHAFFTQHGDIWRVSVPPSTALFAHKQAQLVEWGGALRWISSEQQMFQLAEQHGGHATRYQPSAHAENIFQPLPAAMFALQQRIKQSFDPEHILNPGRLYREK